MRKRRAPRASRTLDFDDRTDFEDADRGLVGALDPCVVTDANGREVWNNDAFASLEGECPDRRCAW